MSGTREAVVVEALRTPIGRRNGMFSAWHAADLLAEVLAGVISRTGLDPELVDDVIVGCVSQIGEQGGNIARTALLSAGYPERVPGVTIDRQCGSSQQAIHFAAQSITAGACDVVVAAGVEVMTHVPILSAVSGVTRPDGQASQPVGRYLASRYGEALTHQGVAADNIARHWNLTRDDLDAFGAESQLRAQRAIDEGRFDREILALPSTPPAALGLAPAERAIAHDETPRPGTTPERLAGLAPAFGDDGLHTAGTSSGIADGAAAVVLVERGLAERLGLAPRLRFEGFSITGSDPGLMLTGPIPATKQILERTGKTIDELDVIEVNEAFASVVLAWQKEMNADMQRVNVNGGAIALGHPTGCSGARLFTTMLHELERTGGRWGLQTMCEGGGMANGVIVERIG
jgi:acetyl-CoA acyltransferase